MTMGSLRCFSVLIPAPFRAFKKGVARKRCGAGDGDDDDGDDGDDDGDDGDDDGPESALLTKKFDPDGPPLTRKSTRMALPNTFSKVFYLSRMALPNTFSKIFYLSRMALPNTFSKHFYLSRMDLPNP